MYLRLVEEVLFGNIRAHGGCNNNPTARQFMAIYKMLIVKVELSLKVAIV